MRTLFMFCLVCIAVFAVEVQAQITISTNTFMPAVGTVLQFKGDPTVDANFYNSLTSGSGGPMIWDFSTRPYSGISIQTVANLATAPKKDSFPNSNLVIRTVVTAADTVWSFQRSVSNAYSALGSVTHTSNGELVTVFRNVAPDGVFPMTLGSSWTAHRTWDQNNPPFLTHTYDTTFYSVDAYGTAKYGTKSVACLRIAMHEQITNVTYKADTLLGSFVTDIYGANFAAAGYTSLVSVSKSGSGTTFFYSSYASADFLSSPTDVKEDGSGKLPVAFSIDQNYPNPFNPNTEIRFSLPSRSEVQLVVYNVNGQEVKTLVNQLMGAGSYVANWDGTNEQNSKVASGVYFYRLETGAFTETKKMILMK